LAQYESVRARLRPSKKRKKVDFISGQNNNIFPSLPTPDGQDTEFRFWSHEHTFSTAL
jgi:hypothetical protein